jgi:hypothetical protein
VETFWNWLTNIYSRKRADAPFDDQHVSPAQTDVPIRWEHISLYAAATLAYERAHIEYKDMARAFAKDDIDDRVTWFAYMLSPFLTVYGIRPPSMKPELYSAKAHRNDCDFVVQDGNIHGISRLTKRVEWERLSVQSDELDAILPKLEHFDPNVAFKNRL